jgi:hypothetical protein
LEKTCCKSVIYCTWNVSSTLPTFDNISSPPIYLKQSIKLLYCSCYHHWLIFCDE